MFPVRRKTLMHNRLSASFFQSKDKTPHITYLEMSYRFSLESLRGLFSNLYFFMLFLLLCTQQAIHWYGILKPDTDCDIFLVIQWYFMSIFNVSGKKHLKFFKSKKKEKKHHSVLISISTVKDYRGTTF